MAFAAAAVYRGKAMLGKPKCARVGRQARLLVRTARQVDPQQVWLLAVPVALCAPALLTVKLVQAESCVCGDLSGVAVIVKLFAVGAMVTV